MFKLAANLDWLFQEIPMTERFAAAKRAGFKGVEILFPYRHALRDLVTAREAAGIDVILVNTPLGDDAKGEKGLACLPGRQADFRASLARALEIAKALGAPRLHVVAGIMPEGADRKAFDAAYRENVRYAADACGAAGVVAFLEPLNTRDNPGFYLRSFDLAAEIVNEVASPALRFQFDVYHCQIIHGDLIRRFEALRPLIGHVQVADVPERSEPGSGEINYANVFAAIARSGYDGWVSAEYRPKAGTLAGLGWAKPYGLGSA